MSKELISRKALSKLMNISYNELVQQFRNQRSIPPECIGKDGLYELYNREEAIQWVHYLKDKGGHKTSNNPLPPKLMFLNVKAKLQRNSVQKLDNLKNQYYSQQNSD